MAKKITKNDLTRTKEFFEKEIEKLKASDNDKKKLLEPMERLVKAITKILNGKENAVDNEAVLNEESVKALSDLKEIEQQLKGNKAWAVLKTGAQFLFKSIQLLFKSKYSTFAWGGVLALGGLAAIGCLVAGAATIAAYFPLCLLAIGVGALGLAGCALFSDKVGKFVKSCFSTVKSWFSKSSDQGKETEALSQKIAAVAEGLEKIQGAVNQGTLPANSNTQPVELITPPQPFSSGNGNAHSPEERASLNLSSKNASDSESETDTAASRMSAMQM